MIKAYLINRKITANEKAKELIDDALERCEEYWSETTIGKDMEKTTQKEINLIQGFLNKRIKSIRKNLGLNQQSKLSFKLYKK